MRTTSKDFFGITRPFHIVPLFPTVLCSTASADVVVVVVTVKISRLRQSVRVRVIVGRRVYNHNRREWVGWGECMDPPICFFFPPVGLLIQLSKGVCSSFSFLLYDFMAIDVFFFFCPLEKILLRFLLRRCCQQKVQTVRRMPNPSNRIIDDTPSSWARKCSATASSFFELFSFSFLLVFFLPCR